MKEKEEAEEAEDPHPSPSAYRICYKMANHRWISDFKMSMEVS